MESLETKKIFKPNENFMLTYGDGLTNQNLKKLVKSHLQKKLATVTAVRPPIRFGELTIKGKKVVNLEKRYRVIKDGSMEDFLF